MTYRHKIDVEGVVGIGQKYSTTMVLSCNAGERMDEDITRKGRHEGTAIVKLLEVF